MTQGMMLFIWLVFIVPIGIMVTFIPYLTRKTESFGVSIDERHYDDERISGMRRTYAMITGFASLAALLLAVIFTFSGVDERHFVWLMPAVILGLLLIQAIVYLRFHFRMKQLKESRGILSEKVQRVVVDTSFHQHRTKMSYWWFVPHVVLTLITAGIVLYYYDRFPAQIIMQTDLQGNPTNIVDKSYSMVLFPVYLQSFMIALFVLINYGIGASKQQIDPSDPEGSRNRNVIFRRKWSAYTVSMGFMMIVLFMLMAVQPLLNVGQTTLMILIFAMTGVMIIGAVYLSVKLGQGGSRIGRPSGEKNTGIVGRDDDKHWKLGMFYVNPKDPAIFLEKRFGIGWTINLGHPIAVIVFLIILIVPFLYMLFF